MFVCWWRQSDRSFADLILQVSPQPPSSLAPIKSRMETVWYWLTQVHLEKFAKMEKEHLLGGHARKSMIKIITCRLVSIGMNDEYTVVTVSVSV